MMTKISDHIIRQQAELIANSIDFQIVADMLVDSGWTQLTIEYGRGQKWHEVTQWAEDNIDYQYQELAGVWIFESKKDATAFALRWQTSV